MKLKTVLGCLAATATMSANAYLIDFTDQSKWLPADGNKTYTAEYDVGASNSLFVTLSSNSWKNKLSFNSPFDGSDKTAECGPLLLACDGDGIGLSKDVGDEIDNYEKLTLSFSTDLAGQNSVALNIDNIILFDMFGAKDGDSANATFHGDGTEKTWQATESDSDKAGLFVIDESNTNPDDIFLGVSSVDFSGPAGLFGWLSKDDFSLAAINVYGGPIITSEPIPEPETLALFGLGLLAFGIKRKAKK